MENTDEFADAILADGFEDALLGFGYQFSHPVAIYDYYKCVEILMSRDGCDEHDALEFMEFNVSGAWVGESTPIFLHSFVKVAK